MPEKSEWYKSTKLGEYCGYDTHCQNCKPNGDCDSCDTIDGRNISVVSDYASTCDWCAQLTHHDLLRMDSQTQLGYCETCIPELPKEIRERLIE